MLAIREEKYFSSGKNGAMSGITVSFDRDSTRPKWLRAVSLAFDSQLQGLNPEKIVEDQNGFVVSIHDYQAVKNREAKFLVPGAYGFTSDGIFLDYQRKCGLRLSDNRLDYWYDGDVSLSIHYLIQLALLELQSTFIHAAGISWNGKGILFPAFGGIGKTLLISKILQDPRAKLLGDDLVVLTRDGRLRAYPRPFCLYEYHGKFFEEYYRRNKFAYLSPGLLWRIYNRAVREIYVNWGISLPGFGDSRTYKNGSILASAEKLFGPGKIEKDAVPLQKIIRLRQSQTEPQIRIRKIVDITGAADFAADVTAHEWTYYHKSFSSYLIHTQKSVGAYFSEMTNLVKRGFSSAEQSWDVVIPSTSDASAILNATFGFLD